jgi:hypothetical protein
MTITQVSAELVKNEGRSLDRSSLTYLAQGVHCQRRRALFKRIAYGCGECSHQGLQGEDWYDQFRSNMQGPKDKIGVILNGIINLKVENINNLQLRNTAPFAENIFHFLLSFSASITLYVIQSRITPLLLCPVNLQCLSSGCSTIAI